jgi:beta-lactamase superfamily II metal-dependent hydrolase
VFWLRYGSFDALFPGDADQHVEDNYIDTRLADSVVELLKVPHHGSRTGMTEAFVRWLKPKIAVISVGKNTYGHPSVEAIHLLESVGAQVHRTDKEGDVEVVSDGKGWVVK